MNSFGTLFRVSIFGESHGNAVGIVIDGCPAGLSIQAADFSADIDRRRAGSRGTTPRTEKDIPKIVSGIFNNHTTGAPICILFENANKRSRDYSILRQIPRPGHADFVARTKFGGFEDYRGGGHFSGRLTVGLVAAGVIAKKLIKPVNISAQLLEVGGSRDVDSALRHAIENGDSIGGLIECTVSNLPVGLGEPFFESVEALIAHMIFSIPATKGIEFGSGFKAARMKGSESNDNIVAKDGATETNNAGGINGGISNGNDLIFRVPIKPTSSIAQAQRTMNMKTGKMTDLQIEGRHDTCIALRIPVVIEAGTAIVLADLMLREQKIGRIIS